MILTAHQPVFLPWLGLFAKIANAEMFIILDTVQFGAKSFENRNWIKTPNGPQLLTVPVVHEGATGGTVRIAGCGWRRKHLRSIELAYQKARYFDLYYKDIKRIIETPYDRLSELNYDLLMYGMRVLDIRTPVMNASDFFFEGEKSGLVLDMCLKLDAKKYIFGAMGRDYADLQAFADAGIEVEFQNYRHPEYTQLHGEFAPNMSFIDLLFNHGPDSRGILLGGN